MRADALLARAISSHEQGRHEEAESSYRAVLKTHPKNFIALHHLGVLAYGQNKLGEAHELIAEALALNSTSSEAHNNLGNVLRAEGKTEEAIESFRRAVRRGPRNAMAHSNLGVALMDQGKNVEAIAVLEQALTIDPRSVEAHFNLGIAYNAIQQTEKAIAKYQAAIQIDPSLFLPYINLGNSLYALGRLDEAIDVLRKATELQAHPAAFNNLGNCYQLTGRPEEAEESYRKAIELDPGNIDALTNLGLNLATQGRREEAIAIAREALRINPRHAPAVSNLFFEQRHLCDWMDFETTENKLRELVRAGARLSPFAFVTANTPPDEQLICARRWGKSLPVMAQTVPASPATRRPGRIRIGYLSCDFKEHATAFLMAELLERHDRQRFEIFAYSFSAGEKSEIRSRLIAAFDHFIDISETSHADAIRQINEDGIDILIDLKGYTQNARTEIMASRPAPLQASYLGYPGTMGVDFIDYLIADSFLVPVEQQKHFSEKLVYLPHCYQPNDTKRAISARGFTRALFGLPEDGFVFCSFNGNYKIAPAIFDVWMRLLKKTPGSVMWLLEAGVDVTRQNLLREAASRGVEPERIVFAPALVLPEHLERQALADLFLDSFPVNAHTTASDALWAGLPLLTCAGETFVSRVAGSVLHSVGLPELVTDSLEEYEAKALHLAQNPAELQALRDRLAQNRLTSPLFDMARFTRNLESAYQMMWDRWQAGLAPDTIRVQEGVAIAPPAPGFSLAQLEAGRIKAAPIVERISAYVKDGYWLDVDNSDPALMLAASEWGFTPVCVNSRAQNLSVFQKLGFETHDRDVSLLEQSERFRVISLTSLGCLSSSAEALQAARRLLSHNGVLFISTINHGLPLWQLVNETPPAGESGPLTRETLYALLEEHGFAPASYASSSLHRLGMDVIAFKTHGA